MPGERQRKAALVYSFTSPSLRRGRYAGTRLSKRRGKAQGRRGHQHPPHRFARPTHHERAAHSGRPFVKSVFLFWTGPQPVFSFCKKRKWGADPPRGPRAPRPARRVRAAPADTLPVPGPLIRPAFSRPPSPKGEGDSPWISATFLSGEKALRGISDEVPSSVICSANATFPRWGKALRQGSCSDKPAHRPCRRNQPGPVCKKKSGAFAPLLPRPYKALRRSPRTGRGTAASAPPSGSR